MSHRGCLSPLMGLGGALTAAVAAVTSACAVESAPPESGSTWLPIVGGDLDQGDDAVVEVQIGNGFCTGTLIAARVVLTAAHCVEESIAAGDTSNGSVRFGNGQGPWIAQVAVTDMAMHRLYSPPAFLHWDIAALRLAEDAPASIAPIDLNLEPLDSARDLGLSVRTIGFGVTDGASQTGFGLKREVRLTIDQIDYYHIVVGGAGRGSCQGDSGGPTLAVFDGRERIVGVTSFGGSGCSTNSTMTRVDSMQDWLLQVVDAWSGPCQLDGECVTEGCRTVDPDCDPCGFDGECGQDCAQVDLDCPLGARTGDLCGDDFDCESRLCLQAADDPRLHYCSASCDESRPAIESCPPPFSTCASGPDGGEPVCVYSGPTPSAQGATCDVGSDCRSGVCDTANSICVEECGDGMPACPDPYTCRDVAGTRACTVADDQGGCRAAPPSPAGGPPWGGLFLLLAASCALAASRADRRPPGR